MARTGITYIDVANAAQQLQGRGKNPTVDGIRELLGTGSKSTIAQHLRAWKGEQMPDQMALPQELSALVAGLWEKLNMSADERILHIEGEARSQIEQVSQKANSLQQELTMVSQEKLSLDEALFLKEHTINELTNQLNAEQQKNDVFLMQQEAHLAQLNEMKNDNQRLHQLATHIQANLEHYQSAMQQLQIEQNLTLEKQQIFFQQQLSELDTELRSYRQKNFELEHALQSTLDKENALQETLSAKNAMNEKLLQEKQEASTIILKQEMHVEQLQATLTTHQQELNDCKQQYQTVYAQQMVANDQLQRLQSLIQQKEDALQMLRQEKIFLIQENAELKGYLKKLNLKEVLHAE